MAVACDVRHSTGACTSQYVCMHVTVRVYVRHSTCVCTSLNTWMYSLIYSFTVLHCIVLPALFRWSKSSHASLDLTGGLFPALQAGNCGILYVEASPGAAYRWFRAGAVHHYKGYYNHTMTPFWCAGSCRLSCWHDIRDETLTQS